MAASPHRSSMAMATTTITATTITAATITAMAMQVPICFKYWWGIAIRTIVVSIPYPLLPPRQTRQQEQQQHQRTTGMLAWEVAVQPCYWNP